jgi:hypothetical protein
LEELPQTKYSKKFPVWQAAKKEWSNPFAVYEKSLNSVEPRAHPQRRHKTRA